MIEVIDSLVVIILSLSRGLLEAVFEMFSSVNKIKNMLKSALANSMGLPVIMVTFGVVIVSIAVKKIREVIRRC